MNWSDILGNVLLSGSETCVQKCSSRFDSEYIDESTL